MREQRFLLSITLFGLTVSAFVCVTPASAQDGGWSEGGCFWDQHAEWYCPPGHAIVPDKWAAVAYSSSTLRSGISHGEDSQNAAEQLALINCRNAAPDCKLVGWARNTCFALATSAPEGAYTVDYDDDRTRAQNKAIEGCRAQRGKNCVVQASPCARDDPRFAYSQATKPNPYVGVWNLNVAKSDFGKTPPLYIPKSETLVIIAGNSDDDRKFTLRGIGANGKPFQMSFDGMADDKPHPIPGGGSLAYMKSGGWTVRDKNGDIEETGTSSISDDGKTLTNSAVHKTPKGNMNNTLIYDKME